jgi:hypothetical protein
MVADVIKRKFGIKVTLGPVSLKERQLTSCASSEVDKNIFIFIRASGLYMHFRGFMAIDL